MWSDFSLMEEWIYIGEAASQILEFALFCEGREPTLELYHEFIKPSISFFPMVERISENLQDLIRSAVFDDLSHIKLQEYTHAIRCYIEIETDSPSSIINPYELMIESLEHTYKEYLTLEAELCMYGFKEDYESLRIAPWEYCVLVLPKITSKLMRKADEYYNGERRLCYLKLFEQWRYLGGRRASVEVESH